MVRVFYIAYRFHSQIHSLYQREGALTPLHQHKSDEKDPCWCMVQNNIILLWSRSNDWLSGRLTSAQPFYSPANPPAICGPLSLQYTPPYPIYMADTMFLSLYSNDTNTTSVRMRILLLDDKGLLQGALDHRIPKKCHLYSVGPSLLNLMAP